MILIVLVIFGLTVGATAQPYAFGPQPKLGGFVFSITADHLHGVVAETRDQINYCKWNDVNEHINKPENHSYYGRNYSDWRLPTKYELALLYANGEPGGRASLMASSTSTPKKIHSVFVQSGIFNTR